MGIEEGVRCELCSKEAALHCEADSAYMCWGCDVEVHGANFLVARHARILLCSTCHGHTQTIISGSPCPRSHVKCINCSKPECIDQTSSAESGISGSARDIHCREGTDEGGCLRAEEGCRSSVSEVSIDGWSYDEDEDATTQKAKRNREASNQKINLLNSSTRGRVSTENADMKVQVILRRWHRYLNLKSPSTVTLAMHLVEKGLHKLGTLFRQKLRICLAASLWIAATLCENQASLPSVKRVEECTGIPCKLILLVESRLVPLLDWKTQEEQEGWAECF